MEYRFFPRNPDLVLIDTQLVANAPVEFLVAGDRRRARHLDRGPRVGEGRRDHDGRRTATQAGTALAELSWGIIYENAFSALDAVRDDIVTPASRRVVEANTLLSGLGFESAASPPRTPSTTA